MAGKSEQEEYLDSLLLNAIQQDDVFNNHDNNIKEDKTAEENNQSESGNQNSSENTDSEGSEDTVVPDEEELSLDELIKSIHQEAEDTDNSDDDNNDDINELAAALETDRPDRKADMGAGGDKSDEETLSGTELIDSLKDIVEGPSEDSVISDAMDALSEESILTEEPAYGSENDELRDILALDEGMSFNDIPQENYEPSLSDEDMMKILVMDTDNSEEEQKNSEETTPDRDTVGEISDIPADNSLENGNPDGPEAQPESASKKKSRRHKEKEPKNKKKKEMKKFSIKNFFVEYEEDENSSGESDMNRQIIDELYQDTDAPAKEETASDKDKKEKKPKEKKQKSEKPKKPKKPKKEKPSKDNHTANSKHDTGAIIKSVVIAAVIVAVILAAANIFTYRNAINRAENEFAAGNYEAANDILSGMKVKSRDEDLYMKIRTIMSVYRGISSYENFMELDMQADALDALINAVGRKNRNEDLIEKYEVVSEVDGIYSSILTILDDYGISEKDALDYYNIKSLDQYREILESYGGTNASDN